MGSSARKGGSCPWPFSSDLKEEEENEEEVGHHLGPPGRRRLLATPGDPGSRCSLEAWSARSLQLEAGSYPALSASLNAPQPETCPCPRLI